MCGFDRNWCTTVGHVGGMTCACQSAFDGMFERSSISVRSSLSTSSASSSWQPQPMSLQIGPSVVYSDTWSHVTQMTWCTKTANVKPHESKPCFQESAQWKLLQQRLTSEGANRTFVFRRHCPTGWQWRATPCCGEKSGKRHGNGHADERLNFEDVARSRSNQGAREFAKLK